MVVSNIKSRPSLPVQTYICLFVFHCYRASSSLTLKNSHSVRRSATRREVADPFLHRGSHIPAFQRPCSDTSTHVEDHWYSPNQWQTSRCGAPSIRSARRIPMNTSLTAPKLSRKPTRHHRNSVRESQKTAVPKRIWVPHNQNFFVRILRSFVRLVNTVP